MKPDISEEEADRVAESDNPGQFFQDIMMGPSAQLEDRVAMIEERHEGIMRIEQGVKEIQVRWNVLLGGRERGAECGVNM